MPIRDGMTDIVRQMRQYGQAAPNDVFDGITYWTDEQLQQIADRNSRRGKLKIKRVDPDYKIYRIVAPKTAAVEDDLRVYTTDTDVEVTGLFTFNPDTMEVTFTDAQTDDEYYIYGLVIAIYDALAELWETKADQRFNYIDWKAQNNKMNMKQEYDHCVDRALYYRSKTIRSWGRDGRGKWFF